MISIFYQDFLFAVRILFQRPALTILAILALVVSIGMTTTAFSMLNGIFLKPLPFPEPEQLKNFVIDHPESDYRSASLPFEMLSAAQGLDEFSDVAAYYVGTINLSGDQNPERFDGSFVSPNLFSLLRIKPTTGDGFSGNLREGDSPNEILISYRVWENRYKKDPHIIGTEVRANGLERTIVGVMPTDFSFPMKAEVWLPLQLSDFPDPKMITQVSLVGRIKDGVSPEEADQAWAKVYRETSLDSGSSGVEFEACLIPLGQLDWNLTSSFFMGSAILAILGILFIACANVANLLVGRALTRGREMAIRAALGASRKRIISQLLMESFVLSLFGAIGGLLYAAWAVELTWNSQVWTIPYWMSFEIDYSVFLFVLFLIVVTTLISGFLPAWQSSKTEINTALKESTHTSTQFRLGRVTRFLAVFQIAFSCALLFAAGLSIRHAWGLQSVENGYDESRIITMRMGLFEGDYPTEVERDQFYSDLVDRIARLPRVDEAAISTWLGLYGNIKVPFMMEDQPETKSSSPQYVYLEGVGGDFFDLYDLPILRGRAFLQDDQKDSTRVAVVNDTFARKYFPNTDPLGKTVELLLDKNSSTEISATEKIRIVGIVPSIKVSMFVDFEPNQPIVYIPSTQHPSVFMSLLVTSRYENPHDLVPAIKDEILAMDPHLPVYFVKTMEEFIDEQIMPFRKQAEGFLFIGFMALFLASIGVYGMVSFGVNQKRREIGIRMALGASRSIITRHILHSGIRQLSLGLFFGFSFAYLVAQVSNRFFFGIDTQDWRIYLWVAIVLLITVTLSFFFPTRRAIRLSPLEALRYE